MIQNKRIGKKDGAYFRLNFLYKNIRTQRFYDET